MSMLLQAEIAGGMFILAITGVIFFIGLPLLSFILTEFAIQKYKEKNGERPGWKKYLEVLFTHAIYSVFIILALALLLWYLVASKFNFSEPIQ